MSTFLAVETWYDDDGEGSSDPAGVYASEEQAEAAVAALPEYDSDNYHSGYGYVVELSSADYADGQVVYVVELRWDGSEQEYIAVHDQLEVARAIGFNACQDKNKGIKNRYWANEARYNLSRTVVGSGVVEYVD